MPPADAAKTAIVKLSHSPETCTQPRRSNTAGNGGDRAGATRSTSRAMFHAATLQGWPVIRHSPPTALGTRGRTFARRASDGRDQALGRGGHHSGSRSRAGTLRRAMRPKIVRLAVRRAPSCTRTAVKSRPITPAPGRRNSPPNRSRRNTSRQRASRDRPPARSTVARDPRWVDP